MKSKHLHQILRVSIGLVFVLILVRLIDPHLLQESLRAVRLDILFLSVLAYWGNMALRAYRWQCIFNTGQRQMSFKDSYLITLVGIALNIVIPATLGDLARSYYGYKMYGAKEEMLSTVIVDKMFAFCSLFFLGGCSGYLMGYPALGTIAWLLAVVTLIPLAFPLIVPWNAVNALLRLVNRSVDVAKLTNAFTLPVSKRLLVMGISLGGWLFTSFFSYIVYAAFPVKVSFGYVMLIMPAVTVVRLFPFTINALGPTEMATAYFFGKLGIPPTLAILISLTSNVISSIIPGSIGLIIILTSKYKSYRNEM